MRGPVHSDIARRARPNPVTGAVEQTDTFWPLLHNAEGSANPHAETQYNLETADGSTCTHTVFASAAHSNVTRWQVGVPGAAVAKFDVLRRNGNGQAFGVSERWRIDAGLPTEFQHNPTYGGAGQEVLQFPTTFPSAHNNKLYFSPPIHWKVEQTSASKLRVEGCVIPLEFNTNGQEASGVGTHSSDRDTLALWHRCRQWNAIDFNWRPDVHRVTTWYFSPVDWVHYPAICDTDNAIFLTDNFALAAGFYDCDTDVLSVIDNVAWSLQDSETIQARTTVSFLTGGVVTSAPSPFPRGYACGLVAGSSLAVAAVVKLEQYDNGISALCERTNVLTLFQNRSPAHPAPGHDVNSGQLISWSGHSDGRRAGWLAQQTFIITKNTYPEITAAARQLRLSGVLDTRPQLSELPPHVLAGTEETWGRR